jgi:hypothetical protein
LYVFKKRVFACPGFWQTLQKYQQEHLIDFVKNDNMISAELSSKTQKEIAIFKTDIKFYEAEEFLKWWFFEGRVNRNQKKQMVSQSCFFICGRKGS